MASWATGNRLLSDIGFSPGVPRTSMSADDTVVFFRPLPTDVQVISSLLGLFGDGSGLLVNLNKCSYLGIPLSIYRLQPHHLEPLIDKFFGKMKGWKPKLLVVAGRLTLTKSVLMALLMHFIAVLQFPKWAIKMVDRRLKTWLAVDFPIPGWAFGSTEDWWLWAREKVHKNAKRNFDTVDF
ncbi:hypothetical protein D1007_13271 [Hordeum vulgare]|nr:hypothetical protein D1007_13271 [Hordeum vulgare]